VRAAGGVVWQAESVFQAKAVLLSLEPWDQVWRRNQHLASELVRQKLVGEVLFIEPPQPDAPLAFSPQPGIRVVRPRLPIPQRMGGLGVVAAGLRLRELRHANVLWVNNARLGAHLVSRRVPMIYDVTDDWRTANMNPRSRRALERAEDRLTKHAHVVVCSNVLRDRWRERYSVCPPVVQNAVDLEAMRGAKARTLPGPVPHVGYVGTLHGERLDIGLVLALARDSRIGTVHLIGPDSLKPAERARLAAEPAIKLHGAVSAAEVPGWLVSLDVLVCPHVMSPFTLSLDGIKAHEYLASGKPVVATPTSGFQDMRDVTGFSVVEPAGFVDAVVRANGAVAVPGARGVSWGERAREFAAALADAR
jgi:teichuronic acid biosynthesis glycosyltransferase TuaH